MVRLRPKPHRVAAPPKSTSLNDWVDTGEFRLRGKGVQSVRSRSRGDLMCRVALETPVRLTREQKELLQQFQASYTDANSQHNPRSHSWLQGVREFFDRMTS